jgi:hypothetical protein
MRNVTLEMEDNSIRWFYGPQGRILPNIQDDNALLSMPLLIALRELSALILIKQWTN